MPQWDPQRYLQFQGERTRPFLDLVAQIPTEPQSIVDLGCGPGHLTNVLRNRWPDATILGVDSSEAMIAQANEQNIDPDTSYLQADIADWSPQENPDLIISNAAFQWVPDQLTQIKRLRGIVAPGGTLAFQVPNNYAGPSHTLLAELAGRPPYAAFTSEISYARGVDAVTYLELLAHGEWALNVWETTYLHVLAGADPVFDWISGTGARPTLQALPPGVREQFVAEYRAALREAYPRRPFGTVLPFPRVFVVASRIPA